MTKTKAKNGKGGAADTHRQREVQRQTHTGITADTVRKHRTTAGRLVHARSRDDVIAHIKQMAAQRRWKATTVRTYVGSVIGVFRRADVYGLARIDLENDRIWRDFVRSCENEAMQADVDFPNPATRQTVAKVIKRAKAYGHTAAAAILAIMWATLARFSDVIRLRSRNVKIDEHCAFLFVEGKGVVQRRAPYTVHTTLNRWRSLVKSVWTKRQQETYLFPPSRHPQLRRQVRHALSSEGLELRSLRRGGAQKLADKGVDDDILMRFTGHTNARTLSRYLHWGWHSGSRQRQVNAAKYLW
jgi:integrase